MMQRAKGQPVGHLIGAVLAVPAHVRRLDPDRMAANESIGPT
jgi:hypothetical protein